MSSARDLPVAKAVRKDVSGNGQLQSMGLRDWKQLGGRVQSISKHALQHTHTMHNSHCNTYVPKNMCPRTCHICTLHTQKYTNTHGMHDIHEITCVYVFVGK